MKKLIIICLWLCYASFGRAQSGIKFTPAEDWGQVLEQAKAEHKEIFVDCYATWCGPCKIMEQNVYPLKKVGDVYNSQFISVKLQMDQTASDNAEVKNWYRTANDIASAFQINAYPTFLFFNSDGQPLHKESAALSAKQLIQLALDAKNPAKQYYTIAKNFHPGKTDTAELKNFARIFQYTDKDLAGKMAADYLYRIPRSQLNLMDNGKLMVEFKNDPQVLAIAIDYINRLSPEKFKSIGNIKFMEAMGDQPEIKSIASDFIAKLFEEELASGEYVDFIVKFSQETKVQDALNRYLNHLSGNELYTQANVAYWEVFTTHPGDRGFDIFYHHGRQVDSVTVKGTSVDITEEIIKAAELEPQLKAAEANNTEPDFAAIQKTIASKYDPTTAEHVIFSGKGSLYIYYAYTKKDSSYWPKLLDWRMESAKRDIYSAIGVNNIVYNEFFKHCDNLTYLDTAMEWMKNIVTLNPDDINFIDTYACILYKAGKRVEAVTEEQKALQKATAKKAQGGINLYPKTIAKMKADVKIWLEKDYQ